MADLQLDAEAPRPPLQLDAEAHPSADKAGMYRVIARGLPGRTKIKAQLPCGCSYALKVPGQPEDPYKPNGKGLLTFRPTGREGCMQCQPVPGPEAAAPAAPAPAAPAPAAPALAQVQNLATPPAAAAEAGPEQKKQRTFDPFTVQEAEGVQLHLSASSNSGYKGVLYSPKAYGAAKPYYATIMIGGKPRSLGYYSESVEAALAYAKAAASPPAHPTGAAGAASSSAAGAASSSAPAAPAASPSVPPIVKEVGGVQLHLSSASNTGYTGVHYCPKAYGQTHPYRARGLGLFADAVQAALAYAKAAASPPTQLAAAGVASSSSAAPAARAAASAPPAARAVTTLAVAGKSRAKEKSTTHMQNLVQALIAAIDCCSGEPNDSRKQTIEELLLKGADPAAACFNAKRQISALRAPRPPPSLHAAACRPHAACRLPLMLCRCRRARRDEVRLPIDALTPCRGVCIDLADAAVDARAPALLELLLAYMPPSQALPQCTNRYTPLLTTCKLLGNRDKPANRNDLLRMATALVEYASAHSCHLGLPCLTSTPSS